MNADSYIFNIWMSFMIIEVVIITFLIVFGFLYDWGSIFMADIVCIVSVDEIVVNDMLLWVVKNITNYARHCSDVSLCFIYLKWFFIIFS